jgi:hypothetical protein
MKRFYSCGISTISKISTFALAIIIVLSIGFFSACEEKDENPLIGEWVSITERHAYGDTIVFTSDGKIEKWKELTYNVTDSTYTRAKYKFSEDIIDITKGDNTLSFKYSIDNSNLTIYRLRFAFTILALEKQDITFKKIK